MVPSSESNRSADLRNLPAVDRVIRALGDGSTARAAAAAARRAVDLARAQVRGGKTSSFDEIVAVARDLLDARAGSKLIPIVNATGVLIHTNLGRAVLGRAQLDAVVEIASSYSNLEYDVASGERGDRYEHVARLISELTGAEAAVVANNNAAAVLVTLAALCAGKEVIISRGELVEIGGEFRIPDVMASSGARLVEVGTTNRTHLADYERAITTDTAAILKVHASNYRMIGFTASVSAGELARIATKRELHLIYDLGSGLLASPPDAEWLKSEPDVASALADGVTVTTFSGDKLLGGPQAGIIAGSSNAVDKIARHALMRAVRPDKMTLAALQSTLEIYAEGRIDALPIWQMAGAPIEELEARATKLATSLLSLAGFKVEAVPTGWVAGGGSLPGAEMPSWGVALTHEDRSAAEIGRTLRHADTPVIARVEDDRVVLDVRTILPSDDALVERVVRAALA